MAYKISYKEAGKALTGASGSDNLFLVASVSDLGTDSITGAAEQTNELRLLNEARGTENYVLSANITGIQVVSVAAESYDPSAYEVDFSDDSPVNIDASKVTNGLTIYGNNGDNIIIGTAQDDTIYGNGGINTITGGMGNDYIYSYGPDLVIINKLDEFAGDTIRGYSTTVLLSDSVAGDYVFNADSYIGKVMLGNMVKGKIDSYGTNAVDIDLSQMAYDNSLSMIGNAGANQLIANLFGDTSLTGGLGRDILEGNNSNNSFIYNSDKELTSDETIDGRGGNDSVMLNAAGTYKFGTDSSLKNVEYIYLSTTGKNAINLDLKAQTESFQISNYGYDPVNETYFGNNANNVISTGDGNDIIILNEETDATGNDKVDAGNGNNLIQAGSGNNTLSGGAGNDSIYSYEGNDSISSGDGQSYIDANDGNNTITGGAGYDEVYTGKGNDKIALGEGDNNYVEAGDGNNTITGGAGNDEAYAGIGNDSFSLGDGNNYIGDDGGNNNITLGKGDDEVHLYSQSETGKGVNTVNLGDGRNRIYLSAGNSANVTAGNGDDDFRDDSISKANNTIKFGNGNNYVYGRGSGNYTVETGTNFDNITLSGNGNQKITDLGGTDTLGNLGNQTFNTGNGNDTISLFGGYNNVNVYNGNNVVNGGKDNDNIYAGIGNDSINGGAGNDIINAGNGKNTLDGGDGNDTIYSAVGNDSIKAGAGNDNISDYYGKNTIDGGDGNDEIYSSLGSSVKGGAGDDAIYLYPQYQSKYDSSFIDGGDGNDYLYASSSTMKDTINGGAGNDSIYSGTGDDLIDAGEGANYIYARSGKNNIKSGSGNDIIYTDKGADTILAGDGINVIFAGAGNDAVTTGAGNDTILAGQGSDTVSAGAGDDVIYADHSTGYYDSSSNTFNLYPSVADGNGADNLSGGAGNDIFIISHAAWAKNDVINGEAKGIAAGDNVDTIVYTEVSDFANASAGLWKVDASKVTGIEKFVIDNDSNFTNGTSNTNVGFDLSGFKTALSAIGNDGNNTLIGGSGNDNLSGGNGGDSVIGGAGNDTLTGDNGPDILTGGAGSDLFVFHDNNNTDTITDFVSGTDKIGLDSNAFGIGASSFNSANLAVGDLSSILSSQTSSQYLLFDTASGNLYFDPDANGTEAVVGKNILELADLAGVTSLTISDFMFV